MPTLTANGTQLYYELRGGGPPILLIMGFTGDAGHFDTVAGLLADEFTVITYDRRGNGRSPRPPERTATSVEEQADDAAALLHALDLAPAAVLGTSAGANYALCMAIRHGDTVGAAVLHEPALIRLSDVPDDRDAVSARMRQMVASVGPPAALEVLWRRVAGDANWDRLPPDLRGRMRQSVETFVDVELGSYEDYLPDDAQLAAIAAPVLVVVADDSHAVYAQAAGRVAARLGVDVTRVPGTHTTYHDHPRELAQAIRQFLRTVSGPRL